jgi:hypothetical protein
VKKIKPIFLLFFTVILFSCEKQKSAPSLSTVKKDSVYVKGVLDSANAYFGKDMDKVKQFIDHASNVTTAKRLSSIVPYIDLKYGRYYLNT